MTAFEITRDLILLFLGLFGAGLSLYNYFDLRSRNTRKIELSIDTIIPAYDSGDLSEALFKVTSTNVGQRNVTVTNIGLELPNKRTLVILRRYKFFPDSELPMNLSDGEIAFRYFGYADLKQAVHDAKISNPFNVRPFAVDSAGNRHYGKTLKLDTTQLA